MGLGKITLFSIAFFITQIQVWASDGGSGQPNTECIYRVYEGEKSFLKPRSASSIAFNRATNACQMGLRVPCLYHFYDRFKKGKRKKSEIYSAWNKAITLCKDRVRLDCVLYLEEEWLKFKDVTPNQALNFAQKGCLQNTRAPCVKYVHSVLVNQVSPKKALTDAKEICANSVSGDCIRSLYQDLIPKAAPEIHNIWKKAQEACIREN